MKSLRPLILLLSLHAAFAQTFDVASVKPSSRTRGPDANTQVSFSATGVNGRNVTLKRLIVEAYNLQPFQVSGGPRWLGDHEYEIDGKTDAPATKENLRLMLRALLADRFGLSVHSESKELPVYELAIGKDGPKIRPVTESDTPAAVTGLRGFRGTMQQFANLLSVQLAIPEIDDPSRPAVFGGTPVPVIDKTGLSGVFEINAEMRPEAGASMFNLWQRALQDQFGLKLESRKSKVEILVVDRAEKIPVAN